MRRDGDRSGKLPSIWFAIALLLTVLSWSSIGRAQSTEWEFFDSPVEILGVWRDQAAEGYVTSGLEMTDRLDRYTIVCSSETEQGYPAEGSLIRWSDGYVEPAAGNPHDYVADPRGTPWTKIQWAEACLRMGLLK